MPGHEPYREVWRLTTRPAFLLADLLGVACLMASQFAPDPWRGAVAAVGSACLAIGFSLPIALFYQLRAEAESLGIIDACHRAGIRAIFKSRNSDSPTLRAAIDAAAASSSSGISLLGVAFPSLFNPGGEHTDRLLERLDDPRVHLRVLLLDPDSDAATRRAEIEKGNQTLDDIRFTLDHGIPSVIQERLKRLCQEDGAFQSDVEKNEGTLWSEDFARRIAERSNCEVRLYTLEPMVFLMIFGESVFTEQYHLGRPASLRAGSCIGKHIPVIEYSAAAQAAECLREHFETLWNESRDVTLAVIQKAAMAFRQPHNLAVQRPGARAARPGR